MARPVSKRSSHCLGQRDVRAEDRRSREHQPRRRPRRPSRLSSAYGAISGIGIRARCSGRRAFFGPVHSPYGAGPRRRTFPGHRVRVDRRQGPQGPPHEPPPPPLPSVCVRRPQRLRHGDARPGASEARPVRRSSVDLCREFYYPETIERQGARTGRRRLSAIASSEPAGEKRSEISFLRKQILWAAYR